MKKRGTDLGTDFAKEALLYNTCLVFETIQNKQRAYDAFMEAANKLKQMGHSCSCKTRKCSNVPCIAIFAASRKALD